MRFKHLNSTHGQFHESYYEIWMIHSINRVVLQEQIMIPFERPTPSFFSRWFFAICVILCSFCSRLTVKHWLQTSEQCSKNNMVSAATRLVVFYDCYIDELLEECGVRTQTQQQQQCREQKKWFDSCFCCSFFRSVNDLHVQRCTM